VDTQTAGLDVAREGADRKGLVDYALQYAARGWPVFQLSKSKKPFKGSHGFLDATTDLATIEEWWARRPGANIGLATGHGLIVLDVDGPEGLAELQALVTLHGRLPPTLSARTGSGAHVYFTGQGVKSSARGKLHVRGDGGYVVLPPSLHPNGRRYQWIDPALTVAALPDWLKEWATSGQKEREKESSELRRSGLPHYLQALPGRGLAERAIAAIKKVESAWSQEEENRIRRALRATKAIGYEKWIDIGMALQSLQWVRSDGTDIGLELWDEWSQTELRPRRGYQGRALIESKWATFRGSGKGIGTLFYYAKAEGWNENADDVRDSPQGGGEQVNGAESAAHVLPNGLGEPTSRTIYFDLNKARVPLATAKNARTAIQLLGITCAHDTFHGRMHVGGQVLQQFVGEISDNTVHMLRVMIEAQFRFDPKLENLHDAVVELALQNQYDPVADYLESLTWDGIPRVGTWLTRYLGATDLPITRAMGEKVLIAAVRRVFEPGTKFDQIIVLEGPEGRNKSTAVRVLAGDENFSDQTILTLQDRQQQEQMEGVWLYEIADLTGISRAEVEKVKAFASRQVDRARAVWARKRGDQPRRCIFFATTNERTYLPSQTGNRRFWTIACGAIDIEGLKRDRDQLWAEAVKIEARGASLELPEALWGAARELQEARREIDPWEDILSDLEAHHCTVKDHPDEWRILSTDLLVTVLAIPADRQFNVSAKRVANAMERLGWVGPKMIRHGTRNRKGYVKRKE
jgi:hypothetical protein